MFYKPKHIIFDLAGVFFNIDFNSVPNYFDQHGFTNFKQYFTKTNYGAFFNNLDLGIYSYDTVFETFRKHFKCQLSDNCIRTGFETLIGSFRPRLINWVKTHQNQYKFYLLSNNNPVSYPYIMMRFYEEFGFSFDTLFQKTFYSQNLKMMKPDPKIFYHVIEKTGLKPEDTLFVDDTFHNVESAMTLGFKVLYLESESDFFNLNL